MTSRISPSAVYLFVAMFCLPACSSSTKPTAVGGASGTGGSNTQGTGGSTANDASSSVTLVAVPNDQDGPPVAKPSGLAPTPPMGWNSWNAYAAGITSTLIKSVADLMVSNGMQAAGYQYVNIDDGWTLKTRVAPGSEQGDSGVDFTASDAGDSVLEPSPAFGGPNGIKDLADYVHSKGLKLGIYSDRGTETCGHFAASGGYELTDARTFAAWGVDYLKYDNCSPPADVPMQQGYQAMRDGLATAATETGHSIVFSLCSWEFDEWNLQTGQLWRTTGDIGPAFNDRSLLSNSYSNTILQNSSLNKAYAAYAGPNNWNDPDMLEVGNNITLTESKTHFNLWAIMSAPLIAGNKLESMSSDVLAILTNPQVIAVDQDYLGLQGVPVKSTDTTSVWAKPLNKAGARAVLLLNAGTQTQNVSVNLTEVGLSAGSATAFDLEVKDAPGVSIQDSFAADIPSHGSVILRIEGNEPGIPQGTANISDLPWIYSANGQGPAEKDMSNGGTTAADGKPLSLRGTTFSKGLGVAAGSKIIYRLAKRCSKFSAVVGVDDESSASGTVLMQVWADGEKLFDSGKMTGTDASKTIDVDLSGRQKLTLLVTGAGDLASTDHADWADAKITCAP